MTQQSPIRIDPAALRRAPHFSQAVLIPGPARVMYIAGQVAGDGFGTVVSEDFTAQVRAAFDRIETILEEGGLRLSDVVKINAFITRRDNLADYRSVFLERLGEIRPTSTLVIAELVDPQLLVEIEAVAVRMDS
ncbi:MAG: RidA family protein [Caulobacteraceae bacterium]